MNENECSVLPATNSIRKRKSTQPSSTIKKLRSNIPRRKRFQISPIVTESSNSLVSQLQISQLSPTKAASSSSSCFPGEISSLSTWISLGSETNTKKPRSTRRNNNFEHVRDFESRPITRFYLRKKEVEEREVQQKGCEAELSEPSCLDHIKSGELNRNLNRNSHNDLILASDANSLSEVTCIQHETVQPSVVDRVIEAPISVVQNREPELSVSDAFVESNLDCRSSEFTVDQKPNELDLEYSLACSEDDLSYEDDSETLYDLQTEYFPINSSLEFSDYSSSMLVDDSSLESDENSAPPIYFPFYLKYQKQFTKLNSDSDQQNFSQVQEFYDEFTLLKFENEEYEDSYKKFRSRERKLVLYDYADDYSSAAEFGDLVLQQRLLMVNWIVEQSEVLELQSETMFLGVSLLDRFLSRGFFKHKKKLQILGIACLTLATRIEENQPYNCVRQKAFYVGENAYSRAEVVGMEWLVQETLNFQCFLPTIHNFLWFYLKAAKADAEVEKRTNYLAMLSLLDHERQRYWPSTVAAGLVILACLAADQESSCQWVMEAHVRTKNDDLPECIQNLEWLVKYVC